MVVAYAMSALFDYGSFKTNILEQLFGDAE
jgi:hypothetical protein